MPHPPSLQRRWFLPVLLAALAAQGDSVIQNIGQIDRGYEHIDTRLTALGAQIERRS